MTPEEALEQAAKKLGIEPNTWQRKAALTILGGRDPGELPRVGRTALRDLLGVAQALVQRPPEHSSSFARRIAQETPWPWHEWDEAIRVYRAAGLTDLQIIKAKNIPPSWAHATVKLMATYA